MHGPEDNGPSGGRRAGKSGGPPSRRRHPAESATAANPPGGAGEVPEDPLFIFTRAQSREVDRLCATEFRIPSIILMENAALGIASVARERYGERPAGGDAPGRPPRILVFCGPGNNGGDGLAAARHLANDGSPVTVVLSTTPHNFKGDAATNLAIAQCMGILLLNADQPDGGAAATVEQALTSGKPDLVIDALLGTGLDRPPRGVMADLIGRINELRTAGVPVLAVDVPSGMNADTGLPVAAGDGPPGPVVRASVTVSLLGLKPGYLTLAAQEFLGDCLVAPIGAPRALLGRLGRPFVPATEGGRAEA